MKFYSLFTGIGGFDLGLERSGMQCVGQVELDPKCNDVLSHHWPDVPKYGDIKDVSNLEKTNLICGGFPCQDLSVAGNRAGLNGSRSNLFFEFARIIRETRPDWFIVENVPGLFSSNKGEDLVVVLETLAECGYGVAWRVLDSQYFGVAQRRRRVFIVGHFGDGRAAQVLFERESLSWDTAPSRETGQGAAAYACRCAQTSSNGWGIREEMTGALDSSGGDAVAYDIRSQSETGDKIHPLQAKGSGGYSLNYQPVVMEIHGGSKRKDRPNGGFYVREMLTTKPLDTGGLNPNCAQGGVVAFQSKASHTNSMNPSVVPPSLDVGKSDGIAVAQAISENQRAELRLTPYTYQLSVGGGKPRQGYPAALTQLGVRRLTPTEAEILQGFPPGWTDGQSDSARYRQLGNAVTVPVIEWIGRRIMQVEREIAAPTP